MTDTTHTIPTVEIDVPQRGRGQAPLRVTVIGEADGKGVSVRGLRGAPMEPLVMLAVSRGDDPTEALALGLNMLAIERARAATPAGGVLGAVRERLHLAGDPKAARLTAMHVAKLAKQLGKTPEEIIQSLELVA